MLLGAFSGLEGMPTIWRLIDGPDRCHATVITLGEMMAAGGAASSAAAGGLRSRDRMQFPAGRCMRNKYCDRP